jgi:hypothetical protein
MRYPLRALPGAAAAVLALAVAAPAHADFQSVYLDYQNDGNIEPCRYTANELDRARTQIPNDIAQYAPDFEAALDAATRQRQCGGRRGGAGTVGEGVSINAPGKPGGPGGPASADGVLVRRPPVPPRVVEPPPDRAGSAKDEAAAAAANPNRRIPAPVVMLAGLALLIVLGLALVLLGRFLGWNADWLGPARHALGEARMRVGATAGGALDRLRTGGLRKPF